ncbi:MAG: hypothetical protein CMB80_18385 [Flammeovirgaceae bacterium]|nr:hypothetical protein [Flammeovirgaceae bacterium]HCX22984.1 hypothetical protein [Cytophagales bacterium]|tara:strand:+ start:5605 stop:6189 length:585 start_codon:yes stop_codon:yes gene_type:complete
MNAENTQMTPLTKTLALRKPGLFSAYQNYIEPVIGRIVTGSVSLRKIQRKDNDEVRALIQRVLIRKGGVGADNYLYDEELNDIHESYSQDGSSFYVMMYGGEIVGCIGLHRSSEDHNAAQIKKFYFISKNSDEGHENGLIQSIKSRAYQLGYASCFITVEERDLTTIDRFEENGFQREPAGTGYSRNVRLVHHF